MNLFGRESCLCTGFLVSNTPGLLLRLALLLIAAPLTTSALTLGQIDNFADGTAQNWGTGTTPASNISDGGPGGSGDNYLQYTSSGLGGANSRMIVFNSSQWQGNYNSAGITEIAMDLNNFSSQTLSMRIAFFVNSSTGFVTTTPFSLAANSGWQHAVFALTAADFATIGSPGSFNTLLSNFTGQLRILDANSLSLLGDPVAATLGIDNVQAIPEPSTFRMAVFGILVVLFVVKIVPRRRLPTGSRRVDSMSVSVL
jgi:hypothetical protein